MFSDELKRFYEERERYYELYQNSRRIMDPFERVYQEKIRELDDDIFTYERAYNKSVVRHIPIGAPLPWKGETMAEEGKQKLKVKEVTVPEIRGILLSVLKTNIVPFIWGPPGVGKSSIVREVANENNWEIIDLRLSLLNPVDLRGLPTIDHKEKQANWLPPSFLPPENTSSAGLLFLDEINLAPLSVQAAAYQLILDKRVGDYKFPKTWKIVAAGNRETDKANVFKISAPLANRFVHYTVRPDFYSWKAWAETSGVHPTLIQFLALRPTAIFEPPAEAEKAFPSPRSWQFVSDLLDSFDYDESIDVPDELIQTIMGAVGEGSGRELIEFLNSFKMQEVTRKLEEFQKTGKITMPRSTSLRLTIIGAVFEAYVNGKIDSVKYDSFTAKLTGEEQATINEFEKKNADKLSKKYKNVDRMPNEGAKTRLKANLEASETDHVELEDSTDFSAPGTALIVSPNGSKQEIVGYGGVMQNKLTFISRAAGGGKPQSFLVGSTVTKIS